MSHSVDHYQSMPPPTLLSLILSALVTILALVAKYWFSQDRNKHFPPGPQGIPFLGNLFQVSQDAWLDFTEWKHQYGEIVYINMAGQPMVILNTHKVAADLLDRRAGIYSDRPRLIVTSELLTGGLLLGFTRYGDVWRRMRRAGHVGLNKQVAPNYYQLQVREALLLTQGLLKAPQHWCENYKRASISMVMSVVYDAPVISSEHDPRIARVNNFVMRLVRAALPGAHFVEFFPWMLHIPNWFPKWMIQWKTDALEWYRRDSEMFEDLYNDVQNRVNAGDDRPSFTASLIHDDKKNGLSTREQAWLSGTMLAAGGDTTAGVLSQFMQAMVLYPEAQKRAQDELDAVIGHSRMPTFADRERLPYVSALVREALRWHPVGPIGVMHRSIQDDVYEGYFIPKGTICIPNVWAMNHDPEVYGPDAHHFNPGRFINEDGNLTPALPDTRNGHVTYGFGRRICVGRHVANNSLFIDIACILWALNIRPAKDSKGNPILPDPNEWLNEGLAVRPKPFDCEITYRFPEAEAVLGDALEEFKEYHWEVR